MTFAPFKSGGGYAYGEILTSAQMNQANEDIPYALDGRDGGEYEPSDSLDLQTPTTKEIILNGCTFESAADGGSAQCAGDIDVGGDLTVAGLSLLVGCAAQSLTVTGSSTLGDAAADTITLRGSTTSYERIRAVKSVFRGVDNGVTGQYGFETYDTIYIEPGAAVAASTIWQIAPATAPLVPSGLAPYGEIMSFRHLGTGSAIVVKDPAGTTLATIGPLTSGNLIQVDVAYITNASVYRVIGHGYMP